MGRLRRRVNTGLGPRVLSGALRVLWLRVLPALSGVAQLLLRGWEQARRRRLRVAQGMPVLPEPGPHGLRCRQERMAPGRRQAAAPCRKLAHATAAWWWLLMALRAARARVRTRPGLLLRAIGWTIRPARLRAVSRKDG